MAVCGKGEMGESDATALESSSSPSEIAGYFELTKSSLGLSCIGSTTSRQEDPVLPGHDHDQFHKEEGSELPKEQLDAENLSSQSDEELSQSEPLLSKDSPQMSLNLTDLSLEGHPSGSWMESQENQCEDEMKTLDQPSEKKCNDAENKYLPSSSMQPYPAEAPGDCNGTEYVQPLDLSAELSCTLEVSEPQAVLTSAGNVEEEKTGENNLILSEQCSEEFPENDEFIENTDSKVYIASTPFCHLDLHLPEPPESVRVCMGCSGGRKACRTLPIGIGVVDQEPQDLISPVPCSEELPKRDEFVENTDTYGATITNASFCETDLISPIPCSEELPKKGEFVENTDTYGATITNASFCETDLISPIPCSEELPKKGEFVENTDTYGATITNASFCETEDPEED
jgi:hypothetical protein